MADIFFKCPECDGQLVVDARGTGMQLPCPFCSKEVTIPSEELDSEIVSPRVNGDSAGESKTEQPAAESSRAQRLSSVSVPAQVPPSPSLGPSPASSLEPDDVTADLEWPDEGGHDTITEDREISGDDTAIVPDESEIRRLAAMMNPDEIVLQASDGRAKAITFRCPSCGQVLTAKRAQVGDRVECKACRNEIVIPDYRVAAGAADSDPSRPARGALPSGRNRSLRTADDIRKTSSPTSIPAPRNAASASAPAEPSRSAMAELDPEVQKLLLKELQRLQAEQNPKEQVGPAEERPRQGASRRGVEPRALPRGRAEVDPLQSPRPKPLPPLAQHGEVVPVPEDPSLAAPKREPAAPRRREGRTRPAQESLPQLVTMDTIDLDSEVARQWGAQAVVPTRTLNWVALLAILAVVSVVGYFGFRAYEDWGAGAAKNALEALPPASASEPPSAPVRDGPGKNEAVLTVLRDFHRAISAEEKAKFVRDPEAVLPIMEDHYRMNEPQRGPIVDSSIQTRRHRVGKHWFQTVTGEYAESFDPLHADFIETPDGDYLLDFKSWIGHNAVPLGTFVTDGDKTAQVFRVLVEEYNYRRYAFQDVTRYNSYHLVDRSKPEIWLYGYTVSGSAASDQLLELFSELNAVKKKPKARLTLSLRFATEEDRARGQVIIDEVVREDWIALPEE